MKENALLIGFFARYHPMKDHATFIHAAGLTNKRFPKIQFILCGHDINRENTQLMEDIEEAGIEYGIHLLGEIEDLARLLNSLDISSISSISEGFPRSVGEAMSSGLPCVVTDVGDAASLVGETGRVVSPRDPEALSKAWIDLLEKPDKERLALGLAAPERIVRDYGLENMVKEYDRLYRHMIDID